MIMLKTTTHVGTCRMEKVVYRVDSHLLGSISVLVSPNPSNANKTMVKTTCGNMFVCLGSACVDSLIIFGKNSNGCESTDSGALSLVPSGCCLLSADTGVNAAGVLIAFEKVSTRLDAEARGSAAPVLKGVDLIQIGLAGASNADEALEAITAAIQSHKGPVESLGVLIVDRSKAWVLENAGCWWVAEQIQDGIRQLAGSLSIGSSFHRSADGLFDDHWSH